jgi:hypothetical protein
MPKKHLNKFFSKSEGGKKISKSFFG